MPALLNAELPFVPIDLVVSEPNTEILLLSLTLPVTSPVSTQIVFAANTVLTAPLHTVAPLEILLRYTDINGVLKTVVLDRVAKLPLDEPLQMRGKHEDFICTEASPVSLLARFEYPVPANDSGKPVVFKSFVGAYIKQQPL